jgi:HSP20 family protein
MSVSRKSNPRSVWSFPSLRFPFSVFDEHQEEWIQDFSDPSGLSVFEDHNHVYVEAALPGIKPDEIEMTFDKGVLWIKAEKKEESEEKPKKFYRKAMRSFSYRIAVPGDIDEQKLPDATYKNGMLHIVFAKICKQMPKKVPIKNGS